MKDEAILVSSGTRRQLAEVGKILISKYLYDPNGWTPKEEIQFFHWLEWARKQTEGTSVSLKFGVNSYEVTLIEEYFLRQYRKVPLHLLQARMVLIFPKLVCRTSHEYYGFMGTRTSEDIFRFQMKFPEKTRYPPPNFIGVGYRDSGNARNPATDGSPSWQEVAAANILELKTLEECKRQDQFQIREMYSKFDERQLLRIRNGQLRRIRLTKVGRISTPT